MNIKKLAVAFVFRKEKPGVKLFLCKIGKPVGFDSFPNIHTPTSKIGRKPCCGSALRQIDEEPSPRRSFFAMLILYLEHQASASQCKAGIPTVPPLVDPHPKRHFPMTIGFSGSASRPPYFVGSPVPGTVKSNLEVN